jgi:hypothetical protein
MDYERTQCKCKTRFFERFRAEISRLLEAMGAFGDSVAWLAYPGVVFLAALPVATFWPF